MTNEEYGKIIAKNLKRLAYYTEKSQVEIAKELGVSKATLGAWMNGTRIPKMDKIDLLADYFNVTRNEIMMPNGMVPLEKFTSFERNLILAYRAASEDNKRMVKFALGLVEENE